MNKREPCNDVHCNCNPCYRVFDKPDANQHDKRRECAEYLRKMAREAGAGMGPEIVQHISNLRYFADLIEGRPGEITITEKEFMEMADALAQMVRFGKELCGSGSAGRVGVACMPETTVTTKDTDWKSMNHELPYGWEKYVVLLCEACSADNELKLVTRFQKILRKIHDDLEIQERGKL